MCYSFETSIIAWFLSFLLCVFMLLQPTKYGSWIPLFILTFTQIQIMEAVLWTSIKGGQKQINNTATRMLVYLLLLQPLMNCLLGYVNTGSDILLGMTIVYGGLMLYHGVTSRNDEFYSTVGPNGHLVWNRKHGLQDVNFFGNNFISILYLAGMVIPFLFMEGNIKYIPLGVGIATFLFNISKYDNEFGSQWCISATILSIITIVYVEISSRFNKRKS